MEHLLNKIHLADCMDIMAQLPDKSIDLAIVDPPYGIDIETSGTYFKQFKTKGWDDSIPNKEYFIELKRISINLIVWGGNYFLEHLGSTKCFLIWDKMIGEGMSFADGELAWTSFKKPTRIKKILSRSKYGKIHPTQKPVALYRWLLQNYAKENNIILDTHCGSGSSVIACIEEGFNYIACEIDADYHKASLERLQPYKDQGKLF